MITYDNSKQYSILFHLAGSVIPESLPIGIMCGSIGLTLALLRVFDKTEEFLFREDYIFNALGIQILASVTGYLVVMRTNMALNRWMDGLSNVQLMTSKWGDAYTTLNGFFSGRKGEVEVHERIVMFRMRLAHWFSLLSCLAFASLRQSGDLLDNINDLPIRDVLLTDEVGIGIPRKSCTFQCTSPNGHRFSWGEGSYSMSDPRTSTEGECVDGEQGTDPMNYAGNALDQDNGAMTTDRRRHSSQVAHLVQLQNAPRIDRSENLMREFELGVIAMPTADESARLDACENKVNTVCLWIIQAIVLEVRAKILDTPPPIVTRILQELSNGMLGYAQAHKVALVPFPFPFAQMMSVLLLSFYLILPFYVDNFTRNIFFTPVISFLVPLCYQGLNILSIELEEPFGTDINDVDIEGLHFEFLKMLIDQVRMPGTPPLKQVVRTQDKIIRGVTGGMSDVEQRVNGLCGWDILAVPAARRGERELGNDRLRQLSACVNGANLETSLVPPPTKEGTDRSLFLEESNFEERTWTDEILGTRKQCGCGTLQL